jgi:hypothetical protein
MRFGSILLTIASLAPWRLGVMLFVLMTSSGVLASDHGSHHESAADDEAEVEFASDAKTRGVELGEYRIRAYYPVEAQKSTVRFVLYATVPTERFVETNQLVDSRQHKVRDQVITATRMAPLAVFDEPGLESFRRRVLMRLRRALPELQFDDVYVSDFQLTVKSL